MRSQVAAQGRTGAVAGRQASRMSCFGTCKDGAPSATLQGAVAAAIESKGCAMIRALSRSPSGEHAYNAMLHLHLILVYLVCRVAIRFMTSAH